jgi:AraC-like DNA-binding protein
LDHYALVYITDGGGHFEDTLGCQHRITQGDLLFLFPGIGHTYGPGKQEFWYEIFIVFEGLIFDLWQSQDLLNPHRPVLHLEPVDYWFKQFRDAIWSIPQSGQEYGLVRVCRLQQLLAEILAHNHKQGDDKVDQVWLSEAKAMLTTEFNRSPDYERIADRLGMSYDGFRKRFTRETGVSPARYHTLRRMDRACELLLNEKSTVKGIAHQLGFSDEYHFSKRFKQIIGMSPTGFRVLFSSR